MDACGAEQSEKSTSLMASHRVVYGLICNSYAYVCITDMANDNHHAIILHLCAKISYGTFRLD